MKWIHANRVDTRADADRLSAMKGKAFPVYCEGRVKALQGVAFGAVVPDAALRAAFAASRMAS